MRDLFYVYSAGDGVGDILVPASPRSLGNKILPINSRESLESDESILVGVRIRPLNASELSKSMNGGWGIYVYARL